MAKDEIGGVWRTVGGRRIFIKDGEDLETAMKNSGKFKKTKKVVIGDERDKKLEEYLEKYKNKTEVELRMAMRETDDEIERIAIDKLYKEMKDEDKNIIKAINEEYDLYKKAVENPEAIDPMTENSTDWAELEKKYKDRYKQEKEQPEAVQFENMLKRFNIRTFADDIELQEMSKMTNKELVEFEKSKGGFKTSDNAEFARVKELYYETGLAKYKDKMNEILKKHNIR